MTLCSRHVTPGVSAGQLDPAFASSTASYTLQVPFGTASLTFTPTATVRPSPASYWHPTLNAWWCWGAQGRMFTFTQCMCKTKHARSQRVPRHKAKDSSF